MSVRVDERVARCLTLLKSQEFQPLVEFMQKQHADTLMRLCEARDKDEMLRLQGRALQVCLLYTSPSPRDGATSRMPSSA